MPKKYVSSPRNRSTQWKFNGSWNGQIPDPNQESFWTSPLLTEEFLDILNKKQYMLSEHPDKNENENEIL